MKLTYLAVFSITVLFAAGCTSEVNPTSNADTPKTSRVPESRTTGNKLGSFKAAEHPTQGNARIVQENGRRYIEFDKEFKTDNGPDLYVILYRNATVPESGVKDKDYVQLARLQKTNGTQRYAIPDDVELVNFKSVAIWCRQFNATFGYAPLRG